MTTTVETGRHVTPERIRADAAMMERSGFELAYECPLWLIELDRQAQGWVKMTDPWDVFTAGCSMDYDDPEDKYLRSTNDIPGQPGRFA